MMLLSKFAVQVFLISAMLIINKTLISKHRKTPQEKRMNRKSKGLLSIASAVLVGISLSTSVSLAAEPGSNSSKNIEEGKKIAFSRPKGNCLACHMIIGGASPGNIAPPLIAMKARFPDKQVLRDQIQDASKRNPETSMPLFGRYEILTEAELDKVVDYIYSL